MAGYRILNSVGNAAHARKAKAHSGVYDYGIAQAACQFRAELTMRLFLRLLARGFLVHWKTWPGASEACRAMECNVVSMLHVAEATVRSRDIGGATYRCTVHFHCMYAGSRSR